MSALPHFTVVDVETTGTRAGIDRIIEIGAVRVENGIVVEKFETLLDPGFSIPSIITWLTGINDMMVENSPSFRMVAAKFRAFIGDSVFVGHNAIFDYRFVNMELARTDHNLLNNDILCTVKLARRVFPGLRKYNLRDLCRILDIPHDRAHRAGDDALATAHLLTRLLKETDAETIKNMV